jgi:hypothetical protein
MALETANEGDEVELRLGNLATDPVVLADQRLTAADASSAASLPPPKSRKKQFRADIGPKAHAAIRKWCARRCQSSSETSSTVEILTVVSGDAARGDSHSGRLASAAESALASSNTRASGLVMQKQQQQHPKARSDSHVKSAAKYTSRRSGRLDRSTACIPPTFRRVRDDFTGSERVETKSHVFVADVLSAVGGGDDEDGQDERAGRDSPMAAATTSSSSSSRCADFPADVRVVVNVEKELSPAEMEASRMRFDTHRTRSRKRFEYVFSKWRVDATEVSVEGRVEYECEVEFVGPRGTPMPGREATNGSGGGDSTIRRLAKEGAEFVADMLGAVSEHCGLDAGELCFARSEAADRSIRRRGSVSAQRYFGDTRASECGDPVTLSKWFDVEGSGGGKRRPFPGAMPFNLHRGDIPTLLKRPYLVAEKTDGIRSMLIVDFDGAFLLLGRTLDAAVLSMPTVESAHRAELSRSGVDVGAMERVRRAGTARSSTTATILDGELVRDTATMRPMFLAFDALRRCGRPLAALDFSERIAIAREIVSGYAKAARAAGCDGSLALDLRAKAFRPVRDVGEILFSMMSTDSLGKHSFSCRDYSCRTDGLVFAPDVPHCSGTNYDMFKWKFPDTWTIDAFVERMEANSMVILGATSTESLGGGEGDEGGGGGKAPTVSITAADFRVLVARARFAERDYARLRTDFERCGRGMVVECSLDSKSGLWKYACLRRDKDTCNHCIVVSDTLASQAECVTEYELVAKLFLGCTDWEQRMESAMMEASKFGSL